MMNLTDNFGLNIKIAKIKTVSFIINDTGVSNINSSIRIDFNHLIHLSLSDNFVVFTLQTTFIAEIDGNEQMVLDCTIQNIFEVNNLAQHANEQDLKLDLPPELTITMVGVSISHARAIISGLTMGTNLHDFIIPIVDTVKTTAAFFPPKETVKQMENLALAPKRDSKKSKNTAK